jgi:hypothetical protein
MEPDEIESGSALAIAPNATPAPVNLPGLRAGNPYAPAVLDIMDQVEAKRVLLAKILVSDVHYGQIPGTQKKSLWKPGAEALLEWKGLYPKFVDKLPPVIDLGDFDQQTGACVREGIISYHHSCQVYDRRTHEYRGDADGACSSRESKYRWRDAKAACPDCRVPAIIKTKRNNFWCFPKLGGCGHGFQLTDERITSQTVGRIPNPDLADLDNTILKMSEKRALIAVAIIVTGFSEIFTQDIDEAAETRKDQDHGDDTQDRVNEAADNERDELRDIFQLGEQPTMETLQETCAKAGVKLAAFAPSAVPATDDYIKSRQPLPLYLRTEVHENLLRLIDFRAQQEQTNEALANDKGVNVERLLKKIKEAYADKGRDIEAEWPAFRITYTRKKNDKELTVEDLKVLNAQVARMKEADNGRAVARKAWKQAEEAGLPLGDPE